MIKPGDLVAVVKPTECCGNTSEIGDIFVVDAVEFLAESDVYELGWYCEFCEFRAVGWHALNEAKELTHEFSRLKKIEPLKEESIEDTSVEVPETVR